MDGTAKNTQTKGDRFFDAVLREQFLNTEVIRGFVGRKLRANRLIQHTEGMSDVTMGIDHTLVFHMGGGVAKRFEGGKLTGESNRLRTATLIAANISSAWDIPDDVDVLHLYLDDADLRHFAEAEHGFDSDQLEMRNLMCVDDPFMKHLAPLVLHELQSDLPQSHLMLDGFDGVIAGHLLRAYSNMSDIVLARETRELGHRDAKAVKRTREFLIEHFDKNLTGKEVASAVGIEAFRLMRLFKRDVGVTMHQFVLQQRVEFVKHQLRHTDDRLVDIAFDAGFSSQSHMNVVFKNALGVTPLQYRNIVLN